MSDDDLRAQLSRLDPARGSSDPVESRPAPELLERVMSAPVLTPETSSQPAGGRRRWLAAAAAAAVIAGGAAVAAVAVGGGGSSSGDDKASVLRLALPGGSGTSMSSCVMFDVAILKDMSPAFRGTVTRVDEQKVVLDVDTWYRGGDQDVVELALPSASSSASLDGVTFEQGKRYLVTAADGTVNGCGFTGLATPDLQKSFDEAFRG